ncbi:hypothetical protein [Cognatiluteimonas weifangensis]|uniref:Lipoprotein n=1 Tax=Cognatiluteimonas weifangensis TaxID=2303539 RepID=A0A372DPX1_9GAMM|nr:hypothetical protein [Luteimonas weifangensis]RFP61544.1 hypothetical protein D0Y53_04320 [Luteimonas weifangensis]
MTVIARAFALSTLLLGAAACSRPEPPPTDRPPEPQATPPRATQLRDAIQRPLDRAKAVEPQVLDAARQQRAQIDAQTGG